MLRDMGVARGAGMQFLCLFFSLHIEYKLVACYNRTNDLPVCSLQ